MTQPPHYIACQHCLIVYEMCSGKNCCHDINPDTNQSYVGFCDRNCRLLREKASKEGLIIEPKEQNTQQKGNLPESAHLDSGFSNNEGGKQ